MALERLAEMLLAIALDACSIINLSNASALEIVLGMPERAFIVSPMVAGECHAECVVEVVRLTATCNITLAQEQDIDAALFLELLDNHELGQGETECIAICFAGHHSICCDDRKARAVATDLLGEERVMGSLRLLKWAVEAGRITSDAAYSAYRAMIDAGGFLPTLAPDWFD
jgi:predicted nucleic acid-binding protein